MGCREATTKGSVHPKGEIRGRTEGYADLEGVNTAESMGNHTATAPVLMPLQTSDSESSVNLTILT